MDVAALIEVRAGDALRIGTSEIARGGVEDRRLGNGRTGRAER
jgi:hypothetical protein